MISLSSSSTLCKYCFLSVFRNFKKKISRFEIFCNRADGNFKDFIIAVSTGLARTVSFAAFFRNDMLAVLQVKQGPQLLVTADNDMSSPATIASIGSALGCALVAVKMYGACTPCAAAAHDLYIVNKITFTHC